ncbi:hypothetical protein ELI44_09185 [Rhizobium ruizarguesonis]|uniref:hypothetical protein n=1 Tax=Rhizobium ruizarguesonis TaxID=2081791 RepID=UPI00102FBF14|nr:hypothetical protein [Rhizobium ruizarguesonis]TAU48179.1 hypothetical protein ELI42_09160 [Rhizobium ruizarguesonis]TAU63250.1 hypothetical protein ELI44_09185 [Rhizobium ruizarguesonis]
MILGVLRFYPPKCIGSIGETGVGIHFINAPAILLDDVPDIEELRYTPISVGNCLPLNVEIAVLFNIHEPVSSKCARTNLYPIHWPNVERSDLSREGLL